MTKEAIAEMLSYPTLTPEEFGQITRSGKNSVYNSLNRSEIPHFLVGRNRKIPTAWVRNQLGLTEAA